MFKTGANGRGKYALLNEAQCLLACGLELVYTSRYVKLKSELIAAFQRAKRIPPPHSQALDIMIDHQLDGAIARITQMQDDIILYCRDQAAVNRVYRAIGKIEKGLASVEKVFRQLQESGLPS